MFGNKKNMNILKSRKTLYLYKKKNKHKCIEYSIFNKYSLKKKLLLKNVYKCINPIRITNICLLTGCFKKSFNIIPLSRHSVAKLSNRGYFFLKKFSW